MNAFTIIGRGKITVKGKSHKQQRQQKLNWNEEELAHENVKHTILNELKSFRNLQQKNSNRAVNSCSSIERQTHIYSTIAYASMRLISRNYAISFVPNMY